jgi:hypothetical protein
LAVILKRFRAPLFDFNLGIWLPFAAGAFKALTMDVRIMKQCEPPRHALPGGSSVDAL